MQSLFFCRPHKRKVPKEKSAVGFLLGRITDLLRAASAELVGACFDIRVTKKFRTETLPLLKHPRRISALCFVRYPAKRDGIASGGWNGGFIDELLGNAYNLSKRYLKNFEEQHKT